MANLSKVLLALGIGIGTALKAQREKEELELERQKTEADIKSTEADTAREDAESRIRRGKEVEEGASFSLGGGQVAAPGLDTPIQKVPTISAGAQEALGGDVARNVGLLSGLRSNRIAETARKEKREDVKFRQEETFRTDENIRSQKAQMENQLRVNLGFEPGSPEHAKWQAENRLTNSLQNDALRAQIMSSSSNAAYTRQLAVAAAEESQFKKEQIANSLRVIQLNLGSQFSKYYAEQKVKDPVEAIKMAAAFWKQADPKRASYYDAAMYDRLKWMAANSDVPMSVPEVPRAGFTPGNIWSPLPEELLGPYPWQGLSIRIPGTPVGTPDRPVNYEPSMVEAVEAVQPRGSMPVPKGSMPQRPSVPGEYKSQPSIGPAPGSSQQGYPDPLPDVLQDPLAAAMESNQRMVPPPGAALGASPQAPTSPAEIMMNRRPNLPYNYP